MIRFLLSTILLILFTNLLFAGRYYDAAVGRFLTVDPLEQKYPSISTYAYCINNPLKFYDPDGKQVRPVDEKTYQVILNTLTPQDVSGVSLDKEGFIVLGNGSGGNYDALKSLVESDFILDASISDKVISTVGEELFREIDYRSIYDTMYELEGATNGLSREEYRNFFDSMGFEDGIFGGWYGITLIPGGEKDANGDGRGSIDGNIKVILNITANSKDLTKFFAHEAYGHALFFILKKNPNHDPENNPELEKQINDREREAERNYDEH